MNLAARRAAAGSFDSARPGSATADAAQPSAAEKLGQPHRAAKSTAKRKRSEQGTAPDDAEPGKHVAGIQAGCGLSGQPGVGGAERLGNDDGTASQCADVPAEVAPRVAAKPAKLALVEEDVDWAGDDAKDQAHDS